MNLRALHPDGRRLVTAELISGTLSRWPERAYAELLLDAPCKRDVEPVDEALDEGMRKYAPFDAGIDAWLAPRLHRALPLWRRDAGSPGLWRFLTVIHRPDFVRHRWEFRSLATMKSRYWSVGTRPDSNALYRLWWIAELTRAGGDYTLTERVLARQGLCTNLFVRSLSWYRPVVQASVEVLGEAPGAEVEVVMRRLTKVLSTVLLESCDEAQLCDLLRQLRRDAR